jgi:Protein of unknown function N-terminus (DUF3323)
MDSGGPVQRFRGAEYRRLLAAARRYLERTGGDLAGTVSLKNPDDAERKAVIGLTGKHRAAGSAQIAVRLADLDESLHEATGRGLAELLAALGPPLRDLPRDRERLVAGRDATIRSVEKKLVARTRVVSSVAHGDRPGRDADQAGERGRRRAGPAGGADRAGAACRTRGRGDRGHQGAEPRDRARHAGAAGAGDEGGGTAARDGRAVA